MSIVGIQGLTEVLNFFDTHRYSFGDPDRAISTEAEGYIKLISDNFSLLSKEEFEKLPLGIRVKVVQENPESKISADRIDFDMASIFFKMNDLMSGLLKVCSTVLLSSSAGPQQLKLLGQRLKSQSDVMKVIDTLSSDKTHLVTDLDLSGCSRITDLGPILERFPNVESLSIANVRGLKSLKGIEKLSGSLKTLNASGIAQLTSLEGLDACTKLREVDISGAKNLDDVSAFKSTPNLEQLNLNGNYEMGSGHGLSSLRGALEKLPKLKSFSMTGVATFSNRTILDPCTQLAAVDLSGTGVTPGWRKSFEILNRKL